MFVVIKWAMKICSITAPVTLGASSIQLHIVFYSAINIYIFFWRLGVFEYEFHRTVLGGISGAFGSIVYRCYSVYAARYTDIYR